MRNLLFIRGCPGTGKKTVGELLRDRLGWKLFWLHQIDCIYQITGEHRLPRLQDDVSLAILKELFRQEQNIIFVRAARDVASIVDVHALCRHFGYDLTVVRLKAKYGVMLDRVRQREPSAYRVCDKRGLDEYVTSRPAQPFVGEHVIDTDLLSPLQVADNIISILAKDTVRTV